MEIDIDAQGNVTPESAEAFVAKAFAPQELGDLSPRKVIAKGFECPDCGDKAAVEIGTTYSHKC